MINKKVMAVAVAAALGAPAAAFAQASNVQIYGRANVGLDSYSATGNSTLTSGANTELKSRARVYDSSSRLGVRGTEDLGNGLKAIFQIESGVEVDSGSTTGQSGAANASAGTLASRASWAGLAGNWGDVKFGRQDIYWGNGNIHQMATNFINTDVAFGTGTMGRVAGPVSRQSNTMSYTSPTISGFNATGSYSTNSKTAQASATTTSTNTDATIWGLTARYTGVVNVQYDYAQNQAATPQTGGAAFPRQKLTGNKFGVGWFYVPGANISVSYLNQKNDGIATAQTNFSAVGDNIKQTGWVANWEHTFGNIQALAQYGQLSKASGCSALITTLSGNIGNNGCDGTDVKSYMVAARYLLSKRTAAYVSYNQTNNGYNNGADYTGGGMTASNGTTSGTLGTSLSQNSTGADPKVIAIGVIHNF